MNLLLGTGVIAGIVAGVVALIVLIIVIWAISARNRFVQMENQYEEAIHNLGFLIAILQGIRIESQLFPPFSAVRS